MSIGTSIRRIRKVKGLTQVDLAQRLRITQPAVAAYEAGKRVPDAELLPSIAAALECGVDDFFGDAKPKTSEDKGKRLRPGSRTALLCDLFEKLKPAEQRLVLSQVKAWTKA